MGLGEVMPHTDVLEDIESLPHYREYVCPRCGHDNEEYVLIIQANCEKCDLRVKLRGFASIGTEIEDVIDAVLAWIGQDDEFELAMVRKQVIDSD